MPPEAFKPSNDWLTQRRQEFLFPHLTRGMTALEIGAFVRPTLEPPDFQIKFVDFYDTQTLRSQSIQAGESPDDVVNVDFVCAAEDYRSVVKEKFDILLANHVLEHVTNFIQWLFMAGDLVNEGGLLFLSMPDKRFSFDKFRQNTTLAHLLADFFVEGRDLKSQHALETFIYYDREYIKQPRKVDESLDVSKAKKALQEWAPGVHAHVFTGPTFLATILKPLIFMKLVPWNLVDFKAETPAGEFFTLLRRGAPNSSLTEEEFFKSPE